MSHLYCVECNVGHDLDLAPDEGECIICGGMLIQEAGENTNDFENQLGELLSWAEVAKDYEDN